MLNKVFLQGRLVADPELRHTQQGTPVASYRLAVDRGYKSKDPNAQNADFINVVSWRNTAEFVSRYFTKGRMMPPASPAGSCAVLGQPPDDPGGIPYSASAASFWMNSRFWQRVTRSASLFDRIALRAEAAAEVTLL